MIKKRRKKRRRAGLLALLILAATGTTTTAYLKSEVGKAANLLTVGDIQVELKEEHWDPEVKKVIHPKESVTKDPTVKNTGKNNAYVFLQVVVPKKEISLVDEKTKEKTQRKKYVLFTFRAEKEWELIRTEDLGNFIRYVYGYSEILKPQEETPPLFHEITAVNYLEGETDDQTDYTVQVTAQAIQAELEAGELSEIYQQLLLQAECDDGKGEPS